MSGLVNPGDGSGVLEVGTSVGTSGKGEVIVNHPNLYPDENGCGHIVFSPMQARNFAFLLIAKANQAEME